MYGKMKLLRPIAYLFETFDIFILTDRSHSSNNLYIIHKLALHVSI